MALAFKISYPWRIFLMLLLVAWITTANLLGFQYLREKEYKTELFNAQLQNYNHNILDGLDEGKDISQILKTLRAPISGVRISIIGFDGKVLFDSSSDTLPNSDHLDRPEIKSTIKEGAGYSVRRLSQSTGDTYFYSATKGNSLMVRSAVPYSVDLYTVLEADLSFLWFMIFITVAISAIGYLVSRQLGHTISRLSRFAQKAERGERIYDNEPFPHDELGEIANNIVRLYARLQQATAENDRQHLLALQQEQDKIRLKKELTNNINHELKTPVASMQVCLETILAHPDLPPEKQREFIERSYANIERLRRLLNDVSLITRMDDGNNAINKEDINLRLLIEDTLGEYELTAKEKGFELINDFDKDISIKGNWAMLQSMFRNLIDNAMAYSGGNTVEIKFVSHTPEHIMLIVADNGNGVPDEHLPRLFERFYRIDKGRSRQAGGTGLGLSIVKNAVLLHGGTITVENRPTGGLMFRISLAKN